MAGVRQTEKQREKGGEEEEEQGREGGGREREMRSTPSLQPIFQHVPCSRNRSYFKQQSETYDWLSSVNRPHFPAYRRRVLCQVSVSHVFGTLANRANAFFIVPHFCLAFLSISFFTCWSRHKLEMEDMPTGCSVWDFFKGRRRANHLQAFTTYFPLPSPHTHARARTYAHTRTNTRVRARARTHIHTHNTTHTHARTH